MFSTLPPPSRYEDIKTKLTINSLCTVGSRTRTGQNASDLIPWCFRACDFVFFIPWGGRGWSIIGISVWVVFIWVVFAIRHVIRTLAGSWTTPSHISACCTEVMDEVSIFGLWVSDLVYHWPLWQWTSVYELCLWSQFLADPLQFFFKNTVWL